MSERASAKRGREESRARTTRRAPTPRLAPNAGRLLGAADVAGLQRAVGNSAVAGLLGGIVQRKNLGQTGWLNSLEPEQHTRDLVGDGRAVKVYKAERSTPAANKPEAFQKAAELNAHVGKTVDDRAASAWNITDSNKKWTLKDRQALNSPGLKKVDPFFYEALVSFPEGDMTQYLGFMFQHAASFTGYVEAILDTTNPGAQGVPSMYDKKTEKHLKGKTNSNKGRYLKFSNVHDQTDSSNLLTLTGGGGEEKNLDAYTKIAGEGARWQAVRKHASQLQDDSIFYTRTGTPGDGKVWGVSFQQLWLSWLSAFDKKYDITDATFRGKLAANANFRDGRQNVNVSALAAKDYDLDNSRGHA